MEGQVFGSTDADGLMNVTEPSLEVVLPILLSSFECSRPLWVACASLNALSRTWHELIAEWRNGAMEVDLRGSVSDASLLAVARDCPMLRRLYLSRRSAINDPDVAAVYCPDLQDENISACGRLQDSTLRKLASSCCHLRVVDLSSCHGLGDDTMESICAGCPNLVEIDMSYCTGLGDASMTSVAKHCQGLQALDVSGCELSDSALFMIGESLHELHELHLCHCIHTSDRVAGSLADGCRGLRVLDLFSCRSLTDTGLVRMLQSFAALRCLHLSECTRVTDEGLRAVGCLCPALRRLHLFGCHHMSDEAISCALDRCTALQVLDLSQTRVKDDVVTSLAKSCQQLHTLYLFACDRVSPRGVESLASLKLKTLDLSACFNAVTDVAVAAIARGCTSLMTLKLYGCCMVSDSGVVALTEHCKQIRRLDLSACERLTDYALHQITAQLLQLRRLDVSLGGDSNLTQEALEQALENSPRLHSLFCGAGQNLAASKHRWRELALTCIDDVCHRDKLAD